MKQEQGKLRLVILISGSGTNLQAIIEQTQNHQIPAEIAAVISNRPGVKGLERASLAGIYTEVIDHQKFKNREDFDAELKESIDAFEPSLVVLAGFMRVLTPSFTQHYLGRIMNIHPSLLPKYPGLHTHEQALAADDSEHGASVHFVTAELDGGPLIVQAKVPILKNDTPESLAQRVLQQEHHIYPMAITWFTNHRLALKDNACYLDGELLPSFGYLYQPAS